VPAEGADRRSSLRLPFNFEEVRCPHPLKRSVQARLDGAKRPAGPGGNLGQGQVGPEVEDDHDPLLVGELAQRAERIVTSDDVAERVAPINGVVGENDEPDSSSAAEAISTEVDEDAIEPRLEAGRLAQLPRPAPSLLDGVTDGVLGLGRIAQDETGQAVGSVELLASQLGDEQMHFARLDDQPPFSTTSELRCSDHVDIQTLDKPKRFSGSSQSL
jgi:hypothetical protein